MAIVKYKNQSGITYAYEAVSKYDPSSKSSRPVRKYLGRVDPETGEIIPTAGKSGKPEDAAAELAQKLSDAEAEIERLKAENLALASEKNRLLLFLSKLAKDSSSLLNDINT